MEALYYSLKGKFVRYILQNWLVSFCAQGSFVDIEVYPKALKKTVVLMKMLSFLNYDCLVELTVLDNLGKLSEGEGRFKVTYSFLSCLKNSRINVSTRISSNAALETMADLFSNANWLEREVWDMFGIRFIGHPDLRRILTDYQFEGFPLRKDFPVVGFDEVFYYDVESRIVYLPVALIQEMKQYNATLTTWESEWV